MAASADIRTAGDAVCFVLMGLCVAAIAVLVVTPWVFRDTVMSIVATLFGGPL
jgi:lauroyl/myristoyl acyltransferase